MTKRLHLRSCVAGWATPSNRSSEDRKKIGLLQPRRFFAFVQAYIVEADIQSRYEYGRKLTAIVSQNPQMTASLDCDLSIFSAMSSVKYQYGTGTLCFYG